MLEEAMNQTLTSPPVIRQGDVGGYVTMLQRRLIALEYYKGVADGVFGAQTEQAVRRFQHGYGLTVDGVVGAQTWAALDRAIASIYPGLPKTVQIVETAATVDLPVQGEALAARPTLRRGDRGSYVLNLQNLLIALGYYSGAADGIFGPLTEQAVRNFQSANGLTVDGIVGPQTWAALDNTSGGQPRPTLRMGDRGSQVTRLQVKLIDLGYLTGPADGIFGSQTDAAVRGFQRDKGLTVDGIVGVNTWNALDAAVVTPPGARPVLKEGDTGSDVTLLQEKLKIAGVFPGTVTGSFGPETTQAVQQFQRNNNLVPDGIVGPLTWEALMSQTTAPPPPPGPLPGGARPVLRQGDEGEWVEYLQRELKTLMYYTGAVNGIFGQSTAVAVKAFQDVNRLTPDGIVGRNTWFALDQLFPPTVNCD